MFRWRAESADLDGAARDYEQSLRAGDSPPWLDLALLGLGPDGHTASLFPGTTALAVEDRLAVAVDVPALGTRRLTLTYPAFREAGEVFFLVTGRDKRAALADVVRPESTLPAARIVHRIAFDVHILRPGGLTGYKSRPMTVLAGDIGGTNCRLAIYDVPASGLRGVKPIFEQTYPSASYASLDVIAEQFVVAAAGAIGARAEVETACLGIAGPIENNICRATNLPWVVDGTALSQRLGIARVLLVNDFTAAALGVTAVGADELVALGGDLRVAHGPMAVLGAGTGLGQAFLLWSTVENRYQVVASEGGHVDLAARTPLEHGLVHFLTNKYGRVSCERVLSGKGLVDVFKFLSEEPACRGLIRPETAAVLAAAGNDPRRRDLPASAGRHGSRVRDGARALLLRAGGGRRQPGSDGPGDRRRVRGGRHRTPRPPLPAAGRLSRGVRSQGAPPHAGRTHPRLRGHAPATGPARRRHDRGTIVVTPTSSPNALRRVIYGKYGGYPVKRRPPVVDVPSDGVGSQRCARGGADR